MKVAVCFVALTLTALAQPGQPLQNAGPSLTLPLRISPAVQTCVACHGTHGEGKPNAGFPRIAGQSAYYLVRQLDSYAAGSRRDPRMEPIAKGLSQELKVEVASYYAQVDAPAVPGASPFTAPWADRGRVLAASGDLGRGVQACNNCHGPAGIGQPPAIPYLAGLDDGYIRSTLIAWKEGRRTNDAGQQMAAIVSALSFDDVAAVARYYAGATPPARMLSNIVQSGHPQLLPAGTTRSITVGSTTPGEAGSEGRAPTTGGAFGLGQSGVNPAAPPASSVAGTNSSKGALGPSGDGAHTSGGAARGWALIAAGRYGCTACHFVPGVRAPRGIVGPPLAGLARRPFIAGQLPNTPDVLVAFLRNPPALVPRTGMPDVGLSAKDARDVAAYLYTLAADDPR